MKLVATISLAVALLSAAGACAQERAAAQEPAAALSADAGVDRITILGGKTWLDGWAGYGDRQPPRGRRRRRGAEAAPPRPAGPVPTVAWSAVSGPGTVTFADRASAATTAEFSATGTYLLELNASNGEGNAASRLTVTVEPPPPATPWAPVEITRRFAIQSPLWRDRVKALIVRWIPHVCERISDPELREGGIANFVEAAKKLRGEPAAAHRGYPFSNAWVLNTIESMCVALMVDPQGDPEIEAAQENMRSTLEEWIPIVVAAQEPDGYLQTRFTLDPSNPEHWSRRTRSEHEGYVAGYFLEAAIAHCRLTGGEDTRLYDAAVELADCWDRNIGPAPKKTWSNGHQEMELALARFGRFVNDREGDGKGDRYIALAKFLLDARGGGSRYDQSHAPVVQQYEAVGHAVRAVYSYTGMADVAMETGDVDYRSAVKSLWSNIVHRKYYVTGGVGSGETSEGFGPDYSLRNNAYCESCSSSGELFFQSRLNMTYRDSRYADLYEETLYNALLGAPDLAGENFYYQNPLDSNRRRYPWHNCPCCVGNIPRTLLALPAWIYAKSHDGIAVNLFVGSTVTIEDVAGTDVEIVQATDYPWSGDVGITVNPARARRFGVRIRVPRRDVSDLYDSMPDADGITSIAVNGTQIEPVVERGYAVITREWQAGDRIDLALPLRVQRIFASDKIEATRGKVALRYGPLVYNVEAVDQDITGSLAPDAELTAEWRPDLLGGVIAITGQWADGEDLIAIPNYARNNRDAPPPAVEAGAGRRGRRARRPPTSIVWISAQRPAAAAVEDAVLRARPLPIDRVRLLGGPLAHAQRLDAQYLLELEPDRMLAFYRERAGLPKKAEPYGGWDGGGRNLTGHIAGHYLSAVSLMGAATGDERFAQRAHYVVDELAQVQRANGDGYLCALEGGREAFARLAGGEIRSAPFDLNGEWSPWYTLHKTFAGLRDAFRYTGDRTALEVEIAFAAWAERILSGLDDAQIQRMLNTEFGGMNEVMVDLYADTGDRRWLELSYRFEHRAFTEPLMRHQDELAGKHGNTQVPKLIGSLDRFVYTGDPFDLIAASFFWDRVVQHHSFATGGHGKDEYFGPPDRLSARIDGRTAETCNVYNMLKLTRRLFAVRPDAHYADFHERALFNHILGSMDPEDGSTSYMVPVGRGVQREYANMQRSFTCCVGSGMESHALHGDGIYHVAGDRLWVSLYAPSTAAWDEAGLRLTMDTGFPEGEDAELTLELDAPKELTLTLRRPYWAGDDFSVSVNGERVAPAGRAEAPRGDAPRGQRRRRRGLYESSHVASTWVDLKRVWRSGDKVALKLPKTLRLEPLPDDPRRAAILWGPLVLAGDLGPEIRRGRRGDRGDRRAEPAPVPVLVAAERPVADWVAPSGGATMRFRTSGVGREPNAEGRVSDVELVPFYRLHRRRYAVYWDLFTPDEWQRQRAEYAAEAERKRSLEAASVAYLEPGEIVFERDFHYQGGADARPQRILGRPGRRASSWFSYDVPVDPAHPMALILTFYSDDRRGMPAAFEVLIDGHKLADQRLGRSEPPRFYDVELPIPRALVEGRDAVNVRFQADEGSQVATVFGLRMIRADRKR